MAVILQPLVTELEIVLHAEVPDAQETWRLVTIDGEHTLDVVLFISLLPWSSFGSRVTLGQLEAVLVVAVTLQPLVTELETVLQPEVPDAQVTYRLVTVDGEHLLDVVLDVSLPHDP